MERAISFLDEYDVEMLPEIVNRESISKTIREHRLLPSDAIIALTCKNHGIRWIISLDEDFSRIPWLQILH